MKRGLLLASAVLLLVAFSTASPAGEWTKADAHAYRRATYTPWHGDYYHYSYGRPVALVVPPTAHMESVYNWGVAQTRSVPIYHQFGRPYYGEGFVAPGQFQATPRFPSSTDHFGVYYVRGPW